MTYQTTITQKGQIVIEVDIKKKEIRLRPTSDIFEMAGKTKPRKIVNALHLRDKLEKGYERS